MTMDKLKTQWHPAFCSAMELVLEQDREYLEFIREYNLNKKPLEVDLLIIKKAVGYEVRDDIGKIFKGHNIFEYKSPDDEMNIDTFYKVNAYAALYKASARQVDGIKSTDICISLIRESKPVKLMRNLEKEGFTITNPYKGIYYVGGKAYFSTQIIVSQELFGEQYIWLQVLTNILNEQTARQLIQTVRDHNMQSERELVGSILTVSINANRKMFSKVREDAGMCEALRELMADEINQSIETAVEAAVEAAVENAVTTTEKNTRQEDLKALVDILKGVFPDFDAAYQRIINTEAYSGFSKEQVMEYWK